MAAGHPDQQQYQEETRIPYWHQMRHMNCNSAPKMSLQTTAACGGRACGPPHSGITFLWCRQHREPGRLVGVPNIIGDFACVLALVRLSHVMQGQNFGVGAINSRALETEQHRTWSRQPGGSTCINAPSPDHQRMRRTCGASRRRILGKGRRVQSCMRATAAEMRWHTYSTGEPLLYQSILSHRSLWY